MDGQETKLNAVLGGYFTGNLPESVAVCAFAVDKVEEVSAANFDIQSEEIDNYTNFSDELEIDIETDVEKRSFFRVRR